MDSSEKKQLSEIDICDLFITPSIKEAGWNQLTQIRREVTLTPGPVIVRGNMSSRTKNRVTQSVDSTRARQPRMLGNDAAIGPGELHCSVGDTFDTEPALVHQAVVTAAQ
jgi:hypothetical protein